MKPFYKLAFLILLFTACREQNTAESPITNNKITFFDLKGYFEKEIQRLNQAQPKVQKKVMLNDKGEEKQLDHLDFATELAVFGESDINRRDWMDKYRIDSTLQNNQLTALHYTATDDKLRTRQLDVEFQNGNVSKIFIQNGAKTMVAGSQQALTYLPAEGYFIQSNQRTAISKDRVLRVEVRFVK
jgi:hypothetical protein